MRFLKFKYDVIVRDLIIRELEKSLFQKCRNLKEKIVHVAEIFSRLEKEGFDFLKGFEVAGTIVFEKNYYYCKEEYEAEQKGRGIKNYPDWETIEKNEIKWQEYNWKMDQNVWMLKFDSKTNSFTPYSEFLMKDEGLPGCCSYLKNLKAANKFLTDEDLSQCGSNEFYENIYILLNNDCKKINSIKNFDCKNKHSSEANILSNRKKLLDEKFTWTEENIQKIFEINEEIWKKAKGIKNNMNRLWARLLEIEKDDKTFSDFNIDCEIQYQNKTHPTDIADLPLLEALERNTSFGVYPLCCNDERKFKDDMHDDKDVNWNFEVFRSHMSEEQKKIPFNYWMHAIFVDGSTYSLEDLVRMKAEDLKDVWEIVV